MEKCMLLDKAFVSLLDELPTAPFPRFLEAIDSANAESVGELAAKQGDVAAQLMLLRVSNALVAKYEYVHGHTVVLARPLSLYIDPSNACPLACPGCVHMKEEAGKNFIWPKSMMKPDCFAHLIEEFGPYAFRMMFCNFGEPLLNKATPSYIRRARQFAMATAMSTSFSVPKIDIDALVESGLQYMILSIDGATQENYEKYRKGGRLDLVLENAEKLVEAKRRLGAYVPFAVWQFLVFEHNQHEIELAKQRAEELGLNAVHICRPTSVHAFDPKVLVPEDVPVERINFEYDYSRQLAEQEASLNDLDGEVIGRHFSRKWIERFEANPSAKLEAGGKNGGRACEWLHKGMAIDSGGRILPCCISAPSTERRMEFASLGDPDAFNDGLFQTARVFFTNKQEYRDRLAKLEPPDLGPKEPFCEKCPVVANQRDLHKATLLQQMYGSSLYAGLSKDSRERLLSWNEVATATISKA